MKHDDGTRDIRTISLILGILGVIFFNFGLMRVPVCRCEGGSVLPLAVRSYMLIPGAALAAGVFGLFRKSPASRPHTWMAWVGIALGAGYILLALLALITVAIIELS